MANHLEHCHVSSSFNDVSGGNSPSQGLSTASGLKHNPGLSLHWNAEEQDLLNKGLAKLTSESMVMRFIKIGQLLRDKSVRDVALRVKWMSFKNQKSKRKKDGRNLTRKSKDKKERVSDPLVNSSHFVAQSNAPPCSLPMIMMDNDGCISNKGIGGLTGELLEQNVQALNQISTNLDAFHIQENINLFRRTRDNILTIMNDSFNDQPEEMKKVPPLRVMLNQGIDNFILRTTTLPMQS